MKRPKKASSSPKDREWFWNMAEVAIKDGYSLYNGSSKRRDPILDILEASIRDNAKAKAFRANKQGKRVISN